MAKYEVQNLIISNFEVSSIHIDSGYIFFDMDYLGISLKQFKNTEIGNEKENIELIIRSF